MATHDYYNRTNFPHFVCNDGNWDIYASARGYCAAIPTDEMEPRGCKASHFGDLPYVLATLGRVPSTYEAIKRRIVEIKNAA